MFIQIPTLHSFLPQAARIVPAPTQLAPATLDWTVPGDAFPFLQPWLTRLHAIYTAESPDVATASRTTAIRFQRLPEPESVPGFYRLTVHDRGITVEAHDDNGARYGFVALTQMLAASGGNQFPGWRMDCGQIYDAPRFQYRALMLDSARRYQSLPTIFKVLRRMAAYRLNVLHWHLTDNEGYRIESAVLPELNRMRGNQRIYYTPEDINAVVDYAEGLGIAVIPELEMPGHCGWILGRRPDLACGPSDWMRELCLGNPEAEDLMVKLLHEVLRLFPKSRYIHIGGDEANTRSWDHCPRCQALLQANPGSSVRELERRFLGRMAHRVHAAGRIPIVWETPLTAPEGAVVQHWENDELAREHARRGAQMIFSAARHCYFDYPDHPDEAYPDWMKLVREEDVYQMDAFAGMSGAGEWRLGMEACLWTEFIPEWRLFARLDSRLAAFAECAWSLPERKNLADFQIRQTRLRDAAWLELLDSIWSDTQNIAHHEP